VDLHIWIAQEVLNRISKQGTITLTVGDRQVQVTVPPDRVAAIRRYPEYFRMGSIGPDAYPDVLVGQMIIHPGNPHHWGSADWLQHLLEAATTEQEKAFALGALIHAASDVFAHTYINRYTGAIFNISDNEEASLRHVKLESFISSFMPPLRDAAARSMGLPHEVVRTSDGTLAIPADFLRAHLYFDSAVLDEIKLSGQAGYIPPIQTLKINLDNASKDGGLIDDLTTFGVQVAAVIWGDVYLSKKDAETLKEEAQKLHKYAAFSDEFNRAINEADKAVRGLHSFSREESAKFFATTEKAMSDLLEQRKALDKKRQEVEEKASEWDAAPDHKFEEDIVTDTCKLCSDIDAACKAACVTIKETVDPGAKIKADLLRVKQQAENQLRDLEDQTKVKQQAVHRAALDWMDAITIALDTKIALNEEQASFFSNEHSQDPLKFFVRNWYDGIDRAMNAFVIANGAVIVNTITPGQHHILDPFTDWHSCYFQAILSVPIQITNGICTVTKAEENIKTKVNELEGHIAAIDPVSDKLFELKTDLEKKLLDLKDKLIDKGTEEILKQFDRDFNTRVFDWEEALHSVTDAAELQQTFSVDKSKTGLPLIPDIADRVQSELGNKGGTTLDINKFAPLRNALVLSKIALLDQRGLNDLASKTGVSYGVYGERLYAGESPYAKNVLYGMARSIDGNHQWQEVAPPNPRQSGYDRGEFLKRYDDIEAGFTYRDPTRCIREKGMRMWVDPVARKKLFEKLFVGPLPAGVDLPSLLSPTFPPLLVDYPNTVTKENPWGNDGITLKSDGYVRHAALHGSGMPGTSVVIFRNKEILARAEVDENGHWSTHADMALSRTELLRFAVSRQRKQKVQDVGDTMLSYCSDQTNADGNALAETRSFVLILKDDSLSRLAKLLSGNSRNYVTIFDKNKHLIHDKDLIFPDQIFEVPGEKEWRFKPEGAVGPPGPGDPARVH
jgi:hypothetical protein